MSITTGSSATERNLQDAVLNCLRREKVSVIVHLLNGGQVHGTIRGFDRYVILVESGERLQMVYKHAVSYIEPMKHIGDLLRREMRREREASQSKA
ncbi:MAG TPA: RNA chaperone Hfq [Armatimonadetes bacterium]|nr:RNA chaperone Hfq [Armatimonadota bacterium]